MTTTTPPVVLPSSSINRTAASVGLAPPEMQPMARTLIEHGAGDAAVADGRAGEIGLSMKAYSVPIEQFNPSMVASRDASLKSGWWKTAAYPAGWSQAQYTGGNLPPGALVPVRYGVGRKPASAGETTLVPGEGSDRIVLVEDQINGMCWGYWTFHDNDWNAMTLPNVMAGLGSYSPAICNGGTSLWKPYGPTSSPLGDRGMGTTKRMLVTTGAEVASGAVNHVAELSIAATWYCLGRAQDAKAGTDWLLPARRCEWDAARYATRNRDGHPLDPDRSKLSLEGLRIAAPAVDIARRQTWLDDHFDPGPMMDFWRIITTQWCLYGLMVAETAGYGMRVEMTGLLGSDRPIYERYGWSLATVEAQEYLAKRFLLDHIDDFVVVKPAS